MLLVVTTVGFMVHVYSIGYMHGDDGYNRFFAYLNLFIFSMLMLVLANNYLVLYVGWEAVGLCSYLLIGFWYQRSAPPRPARRHSSSTASATSASGWRHADLRHVRHAELLGVFEPLGSCIGAGTITAICLLLFMGAMGKSAQFPLYVWLPDAMEGPTPVSP